MNMKAMFEFMVEMDLPVPFDDEFLALIPRQRAIVNRLMNQGVITSYAVSIESGKLWVTMLADDESSVFAVISEFPIIRFVESRINRLAFHNSVGFQVPQFSVN
jgi:muconolactone delta-isomerase